MSVSYTHLRAHYVARIFSAGSSIVNNVVTIVNYFNKLEDLLPVIGEV